MNFETYQYVILWSVYLLAALAVIIYCFRWTRWIAWRLPKYLFRLVVVLALVTPTLMVPERGIWAPAIVTAAYDAALQDQSQAFHTLRPFFWGVGLGALVLTLQALVSTIKTRFSNDPSPE